MKNKKEIYYAELLINHFGQVITLYFFIKLSSVTKMIIIFYTIYPYFLHCIAYCIALMFFSYC